MGNNIKYLIKEIMYYKKLEGSIRRIGFKFLLAKTPLQKWVNSPSYNEIYKKRIQKYTKNITPFFLQVENTNFCNARCIMCPNRSMKRKKEIMNQENFEKIIKNVMKAYPSIKTLTINGIGEPLLDKGFLQKIKFVNNKYPNLQIDFYTNAALLNKELVEKLLKTKLHKINFSINGTEATYKNIMGLNYDITRENILYFIKRKEELKKKSPLVNISLMIMKENMQDVDIFKRLWMDKADSVMIYSPSNWGGRHNINAIKTNFKPKRWACTDLWRHITVNVAGDVVLCRRDYEALAKLGNLLKQDAKVIFEGDKINELRQRHINEDFSMPLCDKCDIVFDSSLNWWYKE